MTGSNSPAPAIPLEDILPRIVQQCLCEGDTRGLALGNNFVNARFRAHRIYYFHTFGLKRLHRRLGVKAIARAFDVQPNDVPYTLEKGETIPKGGEASEAADPSEPGSTTGGGIAVRHCV
jgi:hypothetical protein